MLHVTKYFDYQWICNTPENNACHIVCLIKINPCYHYHINLHDNPEMEAIIIPHFIYKETKAQWS